MGVIFLTNSNELADVSSHAEAGNSSTKRWKTKPNYGAAVTLSLHFKLVNYILHKLTSLTSTTQLM